MNLFSTIERTQYSFVNFDQDSLRKSRQIKSNSNRIFNSKIFVNSFFKIRFQITAKNKSASKKKGKKNLQIKKSPIYD